MTIDLLLKRILSEPSPDDLWRLHPLLLALDSPEAASARELAHTFYCYLSCVRSKLTSKQYSTLSAWLEAGSLGSIALQDIVEAAGEHRRHLFASLLAGGLAASLEMLSAYQQVQAWATEFGSSHEEAAWLLYAALWQVSVENQPDLSSEKRQALIDSLLAAIRDPKISSAARVAVAIRLFQTLLLIRLIPVLGQLPTSSPVEKPV